MGGIAASGGEKLHESLKTTQKIMGGVSTIYRSADPQICIESCVTVLQLFNFRSSRDQKRALAGRIVPGKNLITGPREIDAISFLCKDFTPVA